MRRLIQAVPFATATVAFVGYAGTAARTITWWDGSSYPLAAATLGIPGPPGSLLLTWIGWVVSRIPIVQPIAFRLNLLAALIAATLAGLVCWLGARLATPEGREPGIVEQVAGACAGLTFAFSFTPWTYAVQFTPYGLSALWTALLLAAALGWWRRPGASSGRARLFLLFLLLGLDVSVHRTNLLLAPAIVTWIAIRSPRSRHLLRDGAAAAAGLVLGLAFHLLLMPMAARHPPYMVEDPSTWAGWWSYVSIGQKGGGFLIDLYPRTASFVSVQLADYTSFLAHNLTPMMFLPALLAALGWLAILRDHPRRATGLMAFFLCAGLGAVVYFNLPRNYMRPIDRHYLPSLVVLAPWIAVGAAALLRGAARFPRRLAPALALPLAAAIAWMPLAAWRANHAAHDLSRVRFTETYARDLLEPLEERAILFTNGDNDSFPLWYLQEVEGVRRDVAVINLPVANTGLCIAELRRHPDFAPLLAGERLPAVLEPRPAPRDPVVTVVEPRTGLGLPAGVAPPDTVRFHPTGELWGQDRVALDLLRLTRWKRPVYLATTVNQDNVPWLWPFARLDGLAYRIIPSDDPAVHDVEHLRTQLLERVSYAGVADTTLVLDRDSRVLCTNYLAALIQLTMADASAGRMDQARATLRFLDAHTPMARLGADTAEMKAWHDHIAASSDAGTSPSHD